MKGIQLWSVILLHDLVQHCFVIGESSCGVRSEEAGLQRSGSLFIRTTTSSDPPGSWPWMVSYGRVDWNATYAYDSYWVHLCGASIIGIRTVLTAAHCLDDIGRQYIRAGSTDFTKSSSNDYVVRVKKGIIHPRYRRPQAYYDVAVLKLAQDIRYSPYIQPVCLPAIASSDPDEHSFKSVKLTGWGLAERNSFRSNSHLKRVTLSIFSQRYCNGTHSDVTGSAKLNIDDFVPKLFNDEVICAGDELGGGSCKGDSGSPLVWYDTSTSQGKYSLIGVVSGGIGRCGDKKFPGVYVRLGHPDVLSFIQSVIEGTYLSYEKKKEVNKSLRVAAKKGDMAKMKLALTNGADLEDTTKSALSFASSNGNILAAELLLREGADIDHSGYDTPLTSASSSGHDGMVMFLLHHGANVNATNHYGCSPLMLACRWGHASTVQILLEAGADMQAIDIHGRTALSMALHENNESVIKVFQEWNKNCTIPKYTPKTNKL